MSVPTEEEFNADSAAEIVSMLYHLDGTPSVLMINDENGILQDVDRNFAMALAERLLHFAQSLPDTRQILPRHRLSPEKVAEAHVVARQARREERKLRRADGVDDHLRALDG